MSKLEILWPDAAEESIRSARGRLVVAGQKLRRWPFEERLRRVSRLVDAWTKPDSPWRRELIQLLSEEALFTPSTIKEGLDSALRAWSPDDFVHCARRELGSLLQSNRLRLAPFPTISVLSGGELPMPTLSDVFFPLVAGSPVLLRQSSKNAAVTRLLTRSLAEVDEDLARCLEVIQFSYEDDGALAVFLDAPCVVATGSDKTIAHIQSRLRPDQRFVTYGHRFSIAIFGPEILTTTTSIEQAAQGLALDIARWDQMGCLSPVLLYLVGQSIEQRIEVATNLASALESVSERLPRGPLSPAEAVIQSTERAEARMRAATSPENRLYEQDDHFTIVLEGDRISRPAPLKRFLRILPLTLVSELESSLFPFGPHLSNAAIAGFSDREEEAVHTLLERAGISRITHPGQLQTPPIDWPHDGQTAFLPLSRFIQSDI